MILGRWFVLLRRDRLRLLPWLRWHRSTLGALTVRASWLSVEMRIHGDVRP